MNFTIKENSANGTQIGSVPAGSTIRLLSGDKNNNGVPGLTAGADNIIRVTDASELDYERLINIEPRYFFVVTKNGSDDVITVSVTDEANETLLGTPGNDVLQSGFGATLIIGLEGTDQLRAEFSDDILVSGPGADSLTGSAGDDRFVFDAPFKGNVDVVTDFANGVREADVIVLDRDIFGKLKRAKFRDKELSFEQVEGRRAAAQSDALFVYNSRGGALIYNQNQGRNGFGPGGGKFAQLTKGLELSSADFLVQD
jgi:Ca2+-binding RTX toxin-like protein